MRKSTGKAALPAQARPISGEHTGLPGHLMAPAVELAVPFRRVRGNPVTAEEPSPGPPRYVCGRTAFLSDAVIGTVLALAPERSASVEDVERSVRCAQEEHEPDAPHMGLVMELRETGDGAVWLWWQDSYPYSAFTILPDCPVGTPDGMDGCCEFIGHDGGHSWELAGTSRSDRAEPLRNVPEERAVRGEGRGAAAT